MNLFPIDASDRSVFYLGQLFGLVGSLWGQSDTPFPSLPHVLFQTINTTALVLGTLLVVYVTVIGVMQTAHEGEFMGKKWSSMWIPIRMVMGIVGLFPTSSGYSAIQIVIMWIILQGVGAANLLWGNALSYLNAAGGAYSGIPIDTVSTGSNLTTLFQSLTCQQTARRTYGDTYVTLNPDGTVLKNDNKYYYCYNNNNSFCSTLSGRQPLYNSAISTTGGIGLCSQMSSCFGGTARDDTTITYVFGKQTYGASGNCGSVTYSNPNYYCDSSRTQDTTGALKCEAAKGQQAGLDSVIVTFDQIADQFVTADHEYRDFYNTRAYEFRSTNSTAFKIWWNTPNFPPDWLQNYCTNTLKTSSDACCAQYYKREVFNPNLYEAQATNCPVFNSLPSPDDVSVTGIQNQIKNVNQQVVSDVFPNYALNNISLLIPDNNFIAAGSSQYTFSISNNITNYLINHSKDINKNSTDRLGEAAKQGWITAGANYYELTRSGGEGLSEIADVIKLSVSGPDLSSDMNGYRNNIKASNQFASAALNKENAGSFAKQAPEFGAVTDNLKHSLLDTFMQNITGTDTEVGSAKAMGNIWRTNLISSIARYGQNLMITAQTLWAVTLVVAAALSAAFSVNFMALGTGIPGDTPWYAFFKTSLAFIMPFFVALVGALFSLGAILGIYVPLIPFIIFTVGTIGWFIAVIEAMVAGPFIALGILSPAGQHEILGRAEASVMLLLNLFLRPSLMVLGMMMAIYLSDVVLNLINAGFLTAVSDSFHQGIAPGLFEQIILIGAYTTLVVTAINKAFSIVYEVPNRVLTWLGAQAVSFGEAEALGQVQRSVEGAASGAMGAAKGAGGGALKAAGAAGKEMKEKKAADVSVEADKKNTH